MVIEFKMCESVRRSFHYKRWIQIRNSTSNIWVYPGHQCETSKRASVGMARHVNVIVNPIKLVCATAISSSGCIPVDAIHFASTLVRRKPRIIPRIIRISVIDTLKRHIQYRYRRAVSEPVSNVLDAIAVCVRAVDVQCDILIRIVEKNIRRVHRRIDARLLVCDCKVNRTSVDVIRRIVRNKCDVVHTLYVWNSKACVVACACCGERIRLEASVGDGDVCADDAYVDVISDVHADLNYLRDVENRAVYRCEVEQ